MYSQAKAPHPIQDQHTADLNRRTICETRGYCGPFINQEYYDNFPGGLWRGTGECVLCCNTCNTALELEKMRGSTPVAICAVPHRENNRPMKEANPGIRVL